MKIVRVRHFGDNTAREFLFETPRALKKGDLVLTAPKNGKYENFAVCTANSIEVKKEALEYLQPKSEWQLPLAKVIGKYELTEFAKDINVPNKKGADE